jgi:hypothetical protein
VTPALSIATPAPVDIAIPTSARVHRSRRRLRPSACIAISA